MLENQSVRCSSYSNSVKNYKKNGLNQSVKHSSDLIRE